jgi:hypothetical protein
VRLYWTPALILASLYAVAETWLLATVLQSSDPKEATFGLLIFGLPWSMFGGAFGAYYWLIVPLNVITVYFLVLLARLIYRGFTQP